MLLRGSLWSKLQYQSPLLPGRYLHASIDRSIAAYMADPLVSQALSILFTVSPESFGSVTEDHDKALALS